jgi:hypothetical protein
MGCGSGLSTWRWDPWLVGEDTGRAWIQSSHEELGPSRAWGMGDSSGGDSFRVWIWLGAGVRHSLGTGILVVHGSGVAQKAGIQGGCGPVPSLGPCVAWGAGSPAERSSFAGVSPFPLPVPTLCWRWWFPGAGVVEGQSHLEVTEAPHGQSWNSQDWCAIVSCLVWPWLEHSLLQLQHCCASYSWVESGKNPDCLATEGAVWPTAPCPRILGLMERLNRN